MALSPEMMALIKGAKNRYSRGGSKTVKIKEGRTTVRILQTEPKFWRDLGVHWIKDEAGKVVAVVGCADVVYDKPCLIDAAIEKAAKVASDDAMVKMIAEWKTRKTVLVKAIIRDGADGSPDPQILELSTTTFGTVMAMAEEYGADTDPFDANEGMDFVITRSGKGKDTEYKVIPKLKADRVTKDQMTKAKELDLDAFIEKEFFRGDENKALNAIAAATGITLAIAAPARAQSLLTGAASRVEDADEPAPKPSRPAPSRVIEEPVEDAEVIAEKPAAKPAAPKPAPAAAANFGGDVNDADLQSLLDDLDA